jgi:Immunity protein Imm1
MKEAEGVAFPVKVVWQEHGDGIVVASSEELSRLLNRISAESDASRPPLVMISNEGGTLTIGVGAPVSTLNQIPPSGDPPYMISVGDGEASGVIDFYYLGHHSQFAARNAIPNEQARAAVLRYAETGTRSAEVAWEQV